MEALALLIQSVEKRIDESSLPQSGISGNADNAAVTFLSRFVDPSEHCQLCLPPNELERRSNGGLPQGAGRRLILKTANGSDKPVCGRWDRFNVFVVAWLFFKSLTQRRDVPIEIAGFNEAIGPYELHELFLGHHLPSL